MSTSRAVAPSEWASATQVGTSEVYINLAETAAETIVWHWCPKGSDDRARWLGSYIPLHTIVQPEPLTITASLACPNGCPWHGFITNGRWVAA